MTNSGDIMDIEPTVKLGELSKIVALVCEGDQSDVYNFFRNYAPQYLELASKSGHGRGTRRRYTTNAIYIGALSYRLRQIGVSVERISGFSAEMQKAVDVMVRTGVEQIIEKLAGDVERISVNPIFWGMIAEGSELEFFYCDAAIMIMEKTEAGVGFWINLAQIEQRIRNVLRSSLFNNFSE